MGKGKSKKKEASPEPDTVILYIENPIGIYGAKDWYKNRQALGVVFTWFHSLADAGGIERPYHFWYRGGVGSSYLRDIAVDLYVPGSDTSRVQYALGYHHWKDFARLSPRTERDLMLPQDEESRVTTVYLSPCRSTIRLDSDQFLKIPLDPPNLVDPRNFAPGPYPPPTLPYVPTLKSAYKEPLPTRPLPPPSPTPAPQPSELTQPPEDEDEEEKKKKALLASTMLREGRSASVVKQDEGASSRTKEEQLEYEMRRLAESRHPTSPPPQETKPSMTPAPATKEEQLELEMHRLAENRHLTSPPPQETKPEISRARAAKQEQLEHELSRLAQSNYFASPEPPQEAKPSVKEEMLLHELAVLAANGGMVPPERRPSSSVKPDPEARAPVKQEPSATSYVDEPMIRSLKEEQLELEMARLARSASSTPALSSSVKQEPGSFGSMPPESRSTTQPSVEPLAGSPLVVVKPEEGGSTPNPLKRSREGQNGQGKSHFRSPIWQSSILSHSVTPPVFDTDHSAEKRFKREWQY
ncbi:hypothetical protein FS837_012840 [Tulasnella sp. UAMH 9824]|nr:hypothetical protein FS837_012840 [Tulasnella sp. UAMH 9824]